MTQESQNPIVAFMQQEIHILGLSPKMWMICAALAGLILVILVIALIVSHKKSGSGAPRTNHSSQAALRTDLENTDMFEEDPIHQVIDGPTVDLETEPLMIEEDPDTIDLPREEEDQTEYQVQCRLFHKGQYANVNVPLKAGAPVIIGRGEDAAIRTNPDDRSVSHIHGEISVRDGQIYYTDLSRNGTIFNGDRTLNREEEAILPLNTKAELEIGTHKVWIFVTILT